MAKLVCLNRYSKGVTLAIQALLQSNPKEITTTIGRNFASVRRKIALLSDEFNGLFGHICRFYRANSRLLKKWLLGKQAKKRHNDTEIGYGQTCWFAEKEAKKYALEGIGIFLYRHRPTPILMWGYASVGVSLRLYTCGASPI